jgi:hypothetical protein
MIRCCADEVCRTRGCRQDVLVEGERGCSARMAGVWVIRPIEPMALRILMHSQFPDPKDCSEELLASDSAERNGSVASLFQTGPLPCTVSVFDRR